MSGRIDASEIQQSLAELGMDVSRENALKILQRFDLTFYPLSHVSVSEWSSESVLWSVVCLL